jgi:hypothetical protein
VFLDAPALLALASPAPPPVQHVLVAFACAVRSQLGAEDGAGALPFNLDDRRNLLIS